MRNNTVNRLKSPNTQFDDINSEDQVNFENFNSAPSTKITKAEFFGMNPRVRGKFNSTNSTNKINKLSMIANMLQGSLELIESDKEGEELIHSSL